MAAPTSPASEMLVAREADLAQAIADRNWAAVTAAAQHLKFLDRLTTRTNPARRHHDAALVAARPDASCALCEPVLVAWAAIEILCDGDQLARRCGACGRLVRPHDWHTEAEGLPVAYVGRRLAIADLGPTGPVSFNVFACYGSSGAVKAVPAVDGARPDRWFWAGVFSPSTLARAILAHLAGVDLPATLWERFALDVTGALPAGEWRLPVEDIIDWLEAQR